MYKVVIVDDEPTVRYGLRNYFDWGQYNMEVIGEADDGDAGLELVNEVCPDIVLTDVRMINMDGIQMSMEIRKQFPNTKIVFVSGYDDVDYLKSAFQVNAVEYVFKPVDFQELQGIIKKVQSLLAEEAKEKQLRSAMQVKLQQSLPLLREKFLMSLVQDRMMHSQRLEERLEFLELNLPLESNYWIITIRIDDSVKVLGSYKEKDRQLLVYGLLNICQELIDRYMSGYAFENQSGEYIAILHSPSEEEEWEEHLFLLAEQIQSNILQWLRISVTIGIGEKASRLSQLSSSFAQSQLAADQKWYLGKNRIITIDSLKREDESNTQLETTHTEQIMKALHAGNTELMQLELNQLFQALKCQYSNPYRFSRNVGLRLTLLSNRLLVDYGISNEMLEERENELWEELFRQETIEDLQLLLQHHLTGVCHSINERRNGRNRNVIEQVRAIIEEKYMQNLTISSISESVYLSATYVSMIYRQETGETVYDYLTKVRIERAKQMLKDPRNKLYEVCEAVGYNDPSHFSKLFKKHTGMNPSRFRESSQ